jgi:hypothetical protein
MRVAAAAPSLARRRSVLAQEHSVGTDLQREPRRFLDDVALLGPTRLPPSSAQLSAKVS